MVRQCERTNHRRDTWSAVIYSCRICRQLRLFCSCPASSSGRSYTACCCTENHNEQSIRRTLPCLESICITWVIINKLSTRTHASHDSIVLANHRSELETMYSTSIAMDYRKSYQRFRSILTIVASKPKTRRLNCNTRTMACLQCVNVTSIIHVILRCPKILH